MEFGAFGSQAPEGGKNIFVLAGEGTVEDVKTLLESANNPGVNTQDDNGYSPLMAAASYGRADIISYLLSAGADVNLADTDGDTSLHHCTDVECLKLLIDNGGDINIKNGEEQTPLELARENLNDEIAEERGEVNIDLSEMNLEDVDADNAPNGIVDSAADEPEEETVTENPSEVDIAAADEDDSEEIKKFRAIVTYLESKTNE